MIAERKLSEVYQEWRRLAETEGEAIGTRNWSLVAACQQAIQHLQEQISRISPAARKEWAKSGSDGTAKVASLKATIHELIQIEQRNQNLLGAMKTTMRTKLDQLDQAGWNLKKIQRSYGGERVAAWSSFS
jgi:hypothetical protein